MKPLIFALLAAAIALSPARAGETFYLGTYTKPGGSKGIYRYELDPATGAVLDHGLAAASRNPSFLALHPSKHFLYAVNEADSGGASAFSIQPDGSLKELNRQSSLGAGATHLSLDREAKNLLVANYDGGSVAVLPVQPDGSLAKATGFMQHTGKGPRPEQKGPHAHCIVVDESNRRALVCDLGVDKLFLYRFDAEKGKLAVGEAPFAKLAPGMGPRHLVLGAHGIVYVNNEMGNSVTVLAPADGGGLREVQSVSTLPQGFTGENTTAEIVLHPNGRFLYVSNRGHNSIAAFRVEQDGKLQPLGHTPSGGAKPRFIGLNPQGTFLLAANEESGNVRVFRLDPESGALTPTGAEFKRPEPVCVLFVD